MTFLVTPARVFALVFTGSFVSLGIALLILLYSGARGIQGLVILFVAAIASGLYGYIRQRSIWSLVNRLGPLEVSAYDSVAYSALTRFCDFSHAYPTPAIHCTAGETIIHISGAFFTRPRPDIPYYRYDHLNEVLAAVVVDSQTVLLQVRPGLLLARVVQEVPAIVVLYETNDASFILELRSWSGCGYWLMFEDRETAISRLHRETGLNSPESKMHS